MIYKDDFVNRLASNGYTKRDANILVNDVIKTIEEALVNGESVMFHGFGTFETRNHAQRKSYNPQTKGSLVIPPYRAIHFTPGQRLKREVKTGVLEGLR